MTQSLCFTKSETKYFTNEFITHSDFEKAHTNIFLVWELFRIFPDVTGRCGGKMSASMKVERETKWENNKFRKLRSSPRLRKGDQDKSSNNGYRGSRFTRSQPRVCLTNCLKECNEDMALLSRIGQRKCLQQRQSALDRVKALTPPPDSPPRYV